MKRLIYMLVVCAVLSAALGGCLPVFQEIPETPGFSDTPDTPGYQGEATTYYNAYLGLEVVVWSQDTVNELNRQNLGVEPRFCRTIDEMEWLEIGDGYQASLLAIANANDPSISRYAGMYVFAEYYPGLPRDEYLDDFGAWLEVDGDDYTYTLESVESVKLGGREYTRFVARVESLDGYDVYYEEYYVTPVGDCYLIAEIDYRDDSSASRSEAVAFLNRFSLSDSGGLPENGGTFTI